jgi:penicillin-binding protein 2
MHEFMSIFGFGEVAGIDIPGEKPGLMPSTDWKRHAYKRAAEQVWFPGETISVGIGQGYMLATPMQLAHAVSAIASRGEIYKPRLVTAVRPAGTPHKIAGKTGSAQVFTIAQNEKYHEKDLAERLLDHALFISFAPADDPKLAVAVFVENGKLGGSTAAPIARKMFDAYLLPDKAPLADNVSVLGTPL